VRKEEEGEEEERDEDFFEGSEGRGGATPSGAAPPTAGAGAETPPEMGIAVIWPDYLLRNSSLLFSLLFSSSRA
jgi:hypothetical protein